MNNTGGAYTPPPEVYQAGTATYARLFRESASLNKDRTALIQDDRSITYAVLDDRSNRMANILLENGLSRGDRVGLLTRNCIEFVEVELAAAKIDLLLFCLGDGVKDLALPALSNDGTYLIETFAMARIPAFNLIETDYKPRKDSLRSPTMDASTHGRTERRCAQ